MFDFLLAPAVIWMRLPIIAGEMFRSPAGHLQSSARLESERMVTEKLAAGVEGLANAGFESLKLQAQLTQLAWQFRPQAFSLLAARAPIHVAHAFHAPAGRQVRRNSRRLSRQINGAPPARA